MTTSTALPRPRDRKSMPEATWKGVGRHGKGRKGKRMQLVISAEEEIDDDGVDASDELLLPAAERVGVSEVDQEVEHHPLEDITVT